jgi:hypothetical protein
MVLMLCLANNLLIFPETVCIYGIMAVPVGFCSGVMDFFSSSGWRARHISAVQLQQEDDHQYEGLG